MYNNETIVAPATSTGKSSINIIRISGDKSLAVAESIFIPKKNKISENPRKMVYGHIVNGMLYESTLLFHLRRCHRD